MANKDEKAPVGVLLTNLGTPDAPTPRAVRHFLREFLQDSRVIELPRLLWLPVLYGVILPLRGRSSAKLYQKVWTDAGSPLLVNARKQALAVQDVLGDNVQVELGMRYGNPSIAAAMGELLESGIRRLLVLPLFPHYASASTGSAIDAVNKVLARECYIPSVRVISSYGEHPGYINAIAKSVEEHWQQHPRGDKLLFSFHGLPKSSIAAGDPYYQQCLATAELVAGILELGEETWQVVFQSRVGPREWLQPYCVDTLKALPRQGIENVDVICPGFSSDCLETLEEIMITNKSVFVASGGKQFNYIPALNDRVIHVEVLTEIIKMHGSGWLGD